MVSGEQVIRAMALDTTVTAQEHDLGEDLEIRNTDSSYHGVDEPASYTPRISDDWARFNSPETLMEEAEVQDLVTVRDQVYLETILEEEEDTDLVEINECSEDTAPVYSITTDTIAAPQSLDRRLSTIHEEEEDEQEKGDSLPHHSTGIPFFVNPQAILPYIESARRSVSGSDSTVHIEVPIFGCGNLDLWAEIDALGADDPTEANTPSGHEDTPTDNLDDLEYVANFSSMRRPTSVHDDYMPPSTLSELLQSLLDDNDDNPLLFSQAVASIRQDAVHDSDISRYDFEAYMASFDAPSDGMPMDSFVLVGSSSSELLIKLPLPSFPSSLAELE